MLAAYTLGELEIALLQECVWLGWVVGFKGECPPYDENFGYERVSEKTTENSERLSRQARLGFEPGTSRLSALKAEPLCHWWGFCKSGTKYPSLKVIAPSLHTSKVINVVGSPGKSYPHTKIISFQRNTSFVFFTFFLICIIAEFPSFCTQMLRNMHFFFYQACVYLFFLYRLPRLLIMYSII